MTHGTIKAGSDAPMFRKQITTENMLRHDDESHHIKAKLKELVVDMRETIDKDQGGKDGIAFNLMVTFDRDNVETVEEAHHKLYHVALPMLIALAEESNFRLADINDWRMGGSNPTDGDQELCISSAITILCTRRSKYADDVLIDHAKRSKEHFAEKE